VRKFQATVGVAWSRKSKERLQQQFKRIWKQSSEIGEAGRPEGREIRRGRPTWKRDVKVNCVEADLLLVIEGFAVGANLHFGFLAAGVDFGFVGNELVFLGDGFDFKDFAFTCLGL